MLSRKTVFVVGAGASCELELPAGNGLKGYIESALKIGVNEYANHFADPAIREAVNSFCRDFPRKDRDRELDSLKHSAKVITEALPFALSIDNYLDAQRDTDQIKALGKLGIASAILDAERHSLLSQKTSAIARLDSHFIEPESPKFTKTVPNTWHLKLVQILTSGKPQAEIDSIFDDVGFVVFNYDRCLEHFLSIALRRYYNISAKIADRAMSKLDILHPYGQVGYLPWQEQNPKVPFGAKAEGTLREVSEGIQTFTEAVESGLAQRVKNMIGNAETLVFMGFGFLPQNVDLLTVARPAQAKRVFLTTLGISENDVPLVVEDIERMLKKLEKQVTIRANPGPMFEPFIERGSCTDLMNNNWLRLTR